MHILWPESRYSSYYWSTKITRVSAGTDSALFALDQKSPQNGLKTDSKRTESVFRPSWLHHARSTLVMISDRPIRSKWVAPYPEPTPARIHRKHYFCNSWATHNSKLIFRYRIEVSVWEILWFAMAAFISTRLQSLLKEEITRWSFRVDYQRTSDGSFHCHAG